MTEFKIKCQGNGSGQVPVPCTRTSMMTNSHALALIIVEQQGWKKRDGKWLCPTCQSKT